jgi:hypothetical protein
VESNWRDKQNYGGAIGLKYGKPSLRTNPLTGQAEPWRITRNYGCNAGKPARYTVKLYFAELEEMPAKTVESGQDRRFDVLLQGKPVLTEFSIQKEAGGINKTIVKTFEHIEVADTLKLSFRRTAKRKYPPVLSGVEVVAE